jgi:septal ring factor EnvC (AmiA/AmiB activator)
MRIGILAWVILGLLTNECVAEVPMLKDELSGVQSGIASVMEKIQQMLLQKELVADQLTDIEKQYGERAAALRKLEKEIIHKRSRLRLIRQNIEVQRNEIALHNKSLSQLLRADFMMNRNGKLKLILNRQDLVKANRMVMYYDYLRKQRLKKMAVIQNSVVELVKLEKQQKKEALLIERDMQRNRIEQSRLDFLRNQRNQLLAEMEQSYLSHEQQLPRLKDSENELQKLIGAQTGLESQAMDAHERESLVGGRTEPTDKSSNVHLPRQHMAVFLDFAELKGQLPWPVSGKSDSKGFHSLGDGILIDAQEGAEIRAVTRGKVVYAQWLSSYGLLMILDHGQGYMSLYGFNQSLYKRIDDWVEAGEVIAGAGQSGGRLQPELYFGIRKNGKPVDPLSWYPLLGRQKVS